MLTQRIKISNDRSSFLTFYISQNERGMQVYAEGNEFEVVAEDAEDGFHSDAKHVSVYEAGELIVRT